jgi:hypothetical protein
LWIIFSFTFSTYSRNDIVKIKLKDFEMASHFLGGVKHVTLLESDAVLLGLYEKKNKSIQGNLKQKT